MQRKGETKKTTKTEWKRWKKNYARNNQDLQNGMEILLKQKIKYSTGFTDVLERIVCQCLGKHKIHTAWNDAKEPLPRRILEKGKTLQKQ